MNAAFWNLFSPEYTANCLAWQRMEIPILPPTGDNWKSRWTANPDTLNFQGKTLLYYRGSGTLGDSTDLHDRIGGAEILKIEPGILELNPLGNDDPLIDIGAAGEFDETDILDPAAVVFQDRVFLYYSAIGKGEDQVGLAISSDGERFEKKGSVLVGRAPEVVVKGETMYLFYQLPDSKGAYQLYLAKSEDGIRFEPVVNEPILPREPESWDSLSLVTARISQEGDTYYMVYGGSSYLADEPDYFGVARSTDLIHWEPHPGNPIFGCGRKGTADGGAIWFPALIETPNEFVMLYEGTRGKYGWDLSSAICMSWLPKSG